MNNVNTYTLPNGLRIVHQYTNSKVAYCGYAINVGSRDETSQFEGMAHFVEHCIFKGTTKRKAWHILNRMEKVGGELNAYTTKEETVVYSVFLKEDFSRAIELLTDIVFNSTFPSKEINKEKEVVIDEIDSYEDNPSELIFDEFENILFDNHPLGHNILGDEKKVRLFDSSDVLDFVSDFYRTENLILFVYGDISFKRITSWAERLTKDIIKSNRVQERKKPMLYVPTNKVVDKDTHQAHVMIGNRGYDAYDSKRTTLYLINNILGGPGMNSRLNVSLREKRALVYNVESNITSYSDTGIFSVYFGCSTSDIDRCVNYTLRELKLLREKAMSSSQLNAAKKQLIGQIGVASDSSETNALGMAKTFLHYNTLVSHKEVFQRIDNVSCKDILDVANEKFREDDLSFLIYK